jgi:O-antigen ligase
VDSLPIATAVIGSLVVLLLVRRPVSASLGLFAFLLPFDSILIPGQIGQIHIHLTWLAGATAIAVLLTTGVLARRFGRPPRAAIWWSLAVFWAGISSLWAVDPDAALFRVPLLALLLLLYLIVASIRTTEKELQTVVWLAVSGGAAAAAVSLYAFARGEWWALAAFQHARLLYGRETLSAGDKVTDPNILGATLILPLSLAIGQLLSSRTRARSLLLMGLVAVIGASMCATMSRGTFVAMVAVFVVYLWRARAKWRLLICIPLVSILVLIMPRAFFGRLDAVLVDRGAGRFDIWQVGLRAFTHYPIIGAGLDCFPNAYNEFVHTGSNFEGFSRAPHNVFLGVSVELGLIGFFLLLGALREHFRLLARALRTDSDERRRMRFIAYEAACWGLLACGFFLDILWEQYFWLTLMLMVAAVQARVPSAVATNLRLWPDRYRHQVPSPLNVNAPSI